MSLHPDVVLKWACDVRKEGAQEAKEAFNLEAATDDFLEVMADPEVDFVKVATSHDVHLPIIEAAAKAGKHVFCE